MKKTFTTLLFLLVLTSCGKNLSGNIVNYTNKDTGIILENNKVTPVEAADMATAITGIFSNEETKSLIRKILSVDAITSGNTLTKSGTTGPDTLMYIVNYADDKGYTFISSDRRSGPVIAFVEQGNFSISDTVNNSLDKMLVDLMINYQSAQIEKFRIEDDKLAEELDDKELYGFFYDDENDVYTKRTVLWSNSTGLYGLSGKNCRNVLVSGPGVYPYQHAPKHPLDYYPMNGCEGFKDHWELSGGVDPLLTTSWGQKKPFNDMAPINPDDETEHAAAGCVAIACAQIMVYNNFPINYPSKYNNGGPTYISALRKCRTGNDVIAANLKEEAAKLVFTVGKLVVFVWGWGDKGTSGFYSHAPAAFRNMGYPYIDTFQELFDEKLAFNELLRKRPLLTSGTDELNVGHSWVIDGFKTMLTWKTKYFFEANGEYDGEIRERKKEESVYFNCNFGWGGTKNGYYLSAIFNANNPPIVSTKSGYDYSTHLIWITPKLTYM